MARQKIDAWRGQIRLPRPIAEWIQARANANYRTMNAEVVELMRRIKEKESEPTAIGAQ